MRINVERIKQTMSNSRETQGELVKDEEISVSKLYNTNEGETEEE